MNNSVIIKGTKSGIIVVLDADIPFEQLIKDIGTKFRDSAKFLGNANMAIQFEGRAITQEEERDILDAIHQNSNLNIICIIEDDEKLEKKFKRSLDQKLMELSSNTGQFFKGNLRSGQVLESETSIIIIGDVNPGAKVVSKGNIVVLGCLKGNAFAGATGNENAFVVALDMRPVQIRIADIIGRSPDKPIKEAMKEAKIAFVEDGNIYIEPLTKDVINDINLY